MKNLVAICLFAALLTGCDVTSESPVAGQNEEIPRELLGTWRMDKFLDAPPDRPATMTIERGDRGIARFLVQKDGESLRIEAVLSRVNGNLVASTQSETGNWTFGALDIDTALGVLRIKLPDPAIIRRDIENGALPGNVHDASDTGHALHIKASPEALKSYLESRPEIFNRVAFEGVRIEDQP